MTPDDSLTGTLTIDFMGRVDSVYEEKAKREFNEYYPNVELSIENELIRNFNETVTELQVKLMSGQGPDIFLVMGEIVDPYKSMKAGVYADLTAFFKEDPNFNVSDFNEEVLYSGQMYGKQYIVPLFYQLPMLLTTRRILEETNLNPEICTDYFSMSEEFARVVRESKVKPEKFCTNFHIPLMCLTYMGTDWINYETETVNLDSPETEHAYRMLKEDFLPVIRTYSDDMQYYLTPAAEEIDKGETLFISLESMTRDMLVKNIRILSGLGETPVLIAWPDVSGNIQAKEVLSLGVNNSCQNKQAAYNFIKLVMRTDFNTPEILGLDGNSMGIPISKQAMRDYLESQTEEIKYWMKSGTGYLSGEIPQPLIEQMFSYMDRVVGMGYEPSSRYTVEHIMEDYWNGDRSYRTCIEEAQGTLQIYISE